ncbi:MAG: TlpA family protein disulfide reductase [gamma proteobacterium symbiont of Lucinoma myriamae]|nr:TlpA family protein disulfide reductase [gamma proteobacterium symbiont of Lucinoma myriamae]MCU7817966.1 TlpA family protein disulfide reductase [gamma proteobacterium symbiont of Lucinoma myriamae]MCU7832126.1 TlpA family protein disulfide reductase [gamma proteobacterium symbiont of Lucinoma myriamae]
MYNRILKMMTLFSFICLSTPLIAGGTLESVDNGENLASFELEGIDNKIYHLSDYQGKVLLVNFWASWCPPCIQEIPSMQRLEKSFTGRPFEIVAINVSEQKHGVIRRLKRINMTFTVLFDTKGTTFKQWQAKILPTSFIVDKNGHIRYLVKGPMEWDTEEVSEVINKLLLEK